MYELGLGVPKDYAQAVYWYKKSADQGNTLGQYYLGDMYEYGKALRKVYGRHGTGINFLPNRATKMPKKVSPDSKVY